MISNVHGCRWCTVQSGGRGKFLEPEFDLENLLCFNSFYIYPECGVEYLSRSSRRPLICWTSQLRQIWEHLLWHVWVTHICDNGSYWGSSGFSFQPHQLQTDSIQDEVWYVIISWTARRNLLKSVGYTNIHTGLLLVIFNSREITLTLKIQIQFRIESCGWKNKVLRFVIVNDDLTEACWWRTVFLFQNSLWRLSSLLWKCLDIVCNWVYTLH